MRYSVHRFGIVPVSTKFVIQKAAPLRTEGAKKHKSSNGLSLVFAHLNALKVNMFLTSAPSLSESFLRPINTFLKRTNFLRKKKTRMQPETET